MASLVDLIVPPRLGRGFRWLLASAWTSNLGDGIALAAGPLLVAAQTRDPILVSAAAFAHRLPGLLFSLWAGAIADRLDRRRLVMAANTLRAVVVSLLVLAIVTDVVSIWMVIATMFLFGTAEIFADTASATLLPMLVERRDLGIGNARLQAGFVTADQMVGPPIGAFLFGAGMALPFVTQVVTISLAVLLISRIELQHVPPAGERASTRSEIAAGIRWLRNHAAMRTLVLVILLFNLSYGAPWGILVLYAKDHLAMGDVGFGLLMTFVAIGGLLGTVSYGWLERRVALSTLMRVGLSLEVLHHLALALNRTIWIAYAVMFVFGAYAFVWGSLASAIRQRAVPNELQGRVGGVYRLGMIGGLVVGQVLGGLIARRWGLTAPFWFAFVVSGITLVLLWRQLAAIAHADADELAVVDVP